MKNFNIFTTPAPFKPTNIQPSEPKQLQPGMWYEGEIACLLGDQQSGKSLLAIQIAERVAREHSKDTVLYFDFGDDHTICATIETPENSFLRLHVTGYAPEATHLPEKKACKPLISSNK